MNWKNLTIGKKIATGFGITIVLLIVLGALSFTGVGGIVQNAEEVIDGNKLDGNLAQKEVDHLNWVNKVNGLLTDEAVTSLEVETDDHKCGFGKWLYGEGRTRAEALVPSLAPLFKEIEQPHHSLHTSAVHIGKAFKQPHRGLALTLANRLTDHVNWVKTLGKALASEAGGLYSYQAQLKNAVDQVISGIQVFDAEKSSKELGRRQDEALKNIKGLRYGNQGRDYFFIIDQDVRMVMHPIKPELNGKDVGMSKDPTGKRLFTQMAAICRQNGKGFVSYLWPLPGTDKPVPKLSYVKLYKPWGWIVGTGVFLDHTNDALVKRAEEFAMGKPFSAGVQLDPTQCAFGKFLADPKTAALAQSFPELKSALDAIRAPHIHLHESARTIEKRVNLLKMQEAMKIFNSDTQDALEEVKRHFGSAIAAENTLQQGLDTANQIYSEHTVPNLARIQGLLKKIRETARDHIMTDQVMLNAATGTRRNVSIVSAAAVLAALFMAFIIARGIIRALTRISDGLGEGASQVASAAGQVSSSSQSMAEGASEQAASIEETSSSMEEMSSMTRKNAENAGHADGLMKEANQIVQEANLSMNQLTQSMEGITRASEETSKIIKTIDEIAFQTNLLALNAAVEAARAGEAGAGFAVVADEVRNLALRAAQAAKNTAEMIEDTVQKVADGSQLVSTTNEAFTKVAESSAKVGDLISEISQASQEQSKGIEQVNAAITDMDRVVQTNAANAEESASASEEMNAQAEQLRDYVGELMIMVAGGEDRDRPGRRTLKQVRPRPLAADKTREKKLGHEAKEIRPDQVIPFDDEEDFKDF
ncbi:methyl-accepting chemotaxis protein [Desulfospira joergensenii]|uniref:methyl-accepting chemotaxis protein n=1 Tax=Desulfospira joergensenii TaxID=53329 RepID=UPI0003B710F3|nr:methyl-accepting chemotaxis protein [Desulfospira joergensenii]